MTDDRGRLFALMIDAENISPKYIKIILDELTRLGTPTYKRIYGNWENAGKTGWSKDILLGHGLTAVQQFDYTRGKNSSDSVMIIEAMDLLYTGNCDGFCLVTSDSDFTSLANRLRESRMFVVGMGEDKTPKSFIAACDSFKILDKLYKEEKPAEEKTEQKKINSRQGGAKPAAKKVVSAAEKPLTLPKELIDTISNIIKNNSDDEDYMDLGNLGNLLGRQRPEFDTRNYGYSKFSKLIEAQSEFEIKKEIKPDGNTALKVRQK